MPKKPDRSTAPPVPLRVGHVADAARDDHGVPAVRDDWGDQRSVARVREATEAIANIARELTANSTLNFEVLAALDLLEMTCTAAVALAFEMPTPTPNPLARRVAAAKVALRGSMANKGVLQLAVVEFLEQLTDPENDSEGRFQFDMGGERQRRTLEYDGLPA